MNETIILQRIRLAASKIPGVRLFRNNVGKAWMGTVIKQTPEMVVLKNPRFVQFGLQVGSGDLIGWKPVTITPDMVGQKLAVFVSLECKTETGKAKPEQINWMQQVAAAGGIASVVRSEEAAVDYLTGRTY
jgi:ribosomal protein S19